LINFYRLKGGDASTLKMLYGEGVYGKHMIIGFHSDLFALQEYFYTIAQVSVNKLSDTIHIKSWMNVN